MKVGSRSMDLQVKKKTDSLFPDEAVGAEGPEEENTKLHEKNAKLRAENAEIHLAIRCSWKRSAATCLTQALGQVQFTISSIRHMVRLDVGLVGVTYSWRSHAPSSESIRLFPVSICAIITSATYLQTHGNLLFCMFCMNAGTDYIFKRCQ